MTISSQLFLTLILLQATAANIYATFEQWSLPQLFEAAHKNFKAMKRNASQRELISLSQKFSPKDFADLASSGVSESEVAEIVNAFDKIYEFGKLSGSVFSLPREVMPARELYKYSYYKDCYTSKREYKALYKFKKVYTWPEAIRLMFGTTKYAGVGIGDKMPKINVAECAAEAARFNAAYAQAAESVYYRNKYGKILFPYFGLIGIVYAISKA